MLHSVLHLRPVLLQLSGESRLLHRERIRQRRRRRWSYPHPRACNRRYIGCYDHAGYRCHWGTSEHDNLEERRHDDAPRCPGRSGSSTRGYRSGVRTTGLSSGTYSCAGIVDFRNTRFGLQRLKQHYDPANSFIWLSHTWSAFCPPPVQAVVHVCTRTQ
jgi:hypothetical protein